MAFIVFSPFYTFSSRGASASLALFLPTLTRFLTCFYPDYMLFLPAFGPAPLKFIRDLPAQPVCLGSGLPFIRNKIRCNHTLQVPVVSSSGLLEPPSLPKSWATESCPSFPWILRNQHSTNVASMKVVRIWISLASYRRLSPKMLIRSTGWTRIWPCSLKFLKGSIFPSPSALWEMKLSTSWVRNFYGSACKRNETSKGVSRHWSFLACVWGHLPFFLSCPQSSIVPTPSHYHHYSFSTVVVPL